jgi:hypothetical protein
VLEERLLDACTAGLRRRARCAAAETLSAKPQAIAMVSWLGPTRVSVEVGLPEGEPPGWLAREIEFVQADPELERWRAVGFTIALLVDDERFWSAPAEPRVTPSVLPAEAEVVALQAELRGLTGAGIVSGPWRMGAELRLSVMFSPVFFATASANYSVADAEGLDVRWFDTSAGVGVWNPALFEDLEGRLRLELIAENVAVSAQQAGLTDRRNAWVPGLALGGDLLWLLSDPWALSLRADVFLLDGSTVLTSQGERIAASAGAGALIGLGARYRF